jgi:hypothetical protein
LQSNKENRSREKKTVIILGGYGNEESIMRKIKRSKKSKGGKK